MFLMRSPMGNGILDGSSMMMSKLGGRETSYTSHASNIKPLKYYATQILPFSSRFDPQFVFINLNSAHSRSFEINQPQNYMESSLDVGWMKGTFIYNYPHPFFSLSLSNKLVHGLWRLCKHRGFRKNKSPKRSRGDHPG